ncbi:F-box domain-containing protein [Favolaschia claudopus]|uniref:F-box domain-containing protein n=1 Tax=Favolaschia claudopus TaxID=2862362 RepID=A0AAV9ZHE7_9AGAR
MDDHRVPALRLPFELISAIFILCLPLHRRVRAHPNKAPLNLASICTQWRTIALGTPELWASIFLEFSDSYGYDSSQTDSVVAALTMALWFTRASDHPLSISLLCSPETNLPHDLLTQMVAYKRQWGRLELIISAADFLVFNEIPGPFPLLSSLLIQVADGARAVSNTRTTAAQSSVSPNLRALQVPNYTYSISSPETLSLFPTNLTALRLGCVALQSEITTGGIFGPLFHFMPHLLHLDVTVYFAAPRLNDTAKISSTSLVTLRLNNDLPLDSLIAPALQHLHVRILTRTPVLTDFIQQSQCRLTTLSLELSDDVLEDILSVVLPLTPALTTLIFAAFAACSVDALMRCQMAFLPVDVDNAAAAFVPHLRNLLICEWPSNGDLTSLYTRWVDLLESRDSIAYAELRIHPEFESDAVIQYPGQEITARLQTLNEKMEAIRIVTKTFTWPEGVEEPECVGDLGE